MSKHIASTPSPTTAAAIILAAQDHNVPALAAFLKFGWSVQQVQEPSTLRTPLHAAIEGLGIDAGPEGQHAAEETVRLLLTNGAIWNDLNAQGETPGCIAFRKGGACRGVYELMVEAGVRAEILLGRIGGWVELADNDDNEGAEEENAGEIAEKETVSEEAVNEKEEKEAVASSRYLESTLTYDSGGTKLVDADSNGVMMAWETGIMERSVQELLPVCGPAKRVLNVGFGMGIVDSAFRRRLEEGGREFRHVIVEPHPDVLKKMKNDGWMDMAGVEVLEGRWQEVLPTLIETGVDEFDAIYFDTFAEPYTALKTFFSECVVTLLNPNGGRFGFFHGLGADRRVSYDVCTRVVELDLFDAGLDCSWIDVKIDLGDESEWSGIRRKYWDIGDVYKLPVCKMVGL